jgi:uncharacterized coiled-coil protein SlyX
MTFEELLQLTESNAKAIAANSDNIAELRAAQDSTRQNLDRLTNLTERYVNASTTVIQRLDEGIAELRAGQAELRAGQEQQARILDYLLRKEQERQNGSSDDQ